MSKITNFETSFGEFNPKKLKLQVCMVQLILKTELDNEPSTMCAWMYWQGRTGKPYWNMQYGFRGHMVVLYDQFTGSDGGAFTEGFRRLGLGKVIGMRTWVGEI